MQHTTIICAALVALLALTIPVVDAYPQDGSGQEANSLLDELPDVLHQDAAEGHVRHKRVTCDLASAFGVEHTLCAGHCYLLGSSGGYCNGHQVCICRGKPRATPGY